MIALFRRWLRLLDATEVEARNETARGEADVVIAHAKRETRKLTKVAEHSLPSVADLLVDLRRTGNRTWGNGR